MSKKAERSKDHRDYWLGEFFLPGRPKNSIGRGFNTILLLGALARQRKWPGIQIRVRQAGRLLTIPEDLESMVLELYQNEIHDR